MELKSGLTYPLQLGTWTITSSGSPMQALYATWYDERKEPYAGGFGMPAFDIDEPGWTSSYERGTTSWRVWWLAKGKIALEADDMDVYVQADPTWISHPGLSLTLGSSLTGQPPARTVEPHGAFTITNLGGGDFTLTADSGQIVAVRRDRDGWRRMGWGCTGIDVGAPPQPSDATLHVAPGSHVPLLLMTGSGKGLTLSGVDFAEGGWIATLAGTDFSGADLRNADFSRLPDTSLSGCDFTGANLVGAKLGGADINGATFTNAKLSDTVLSGVKTGGADRRILLKGADLSRSDLSALDLGGCDLTGATLSEASVSGTNLTGAQLAGAHFDRCDLAKIVFGPTPRWGGATTERTTFVDALNVPTGGLGKNWSYLDLTRAHLADIPADLTGLKAIETLFPDNINLAGIDLSDSNLTGAQLYLADFTGANLAGSTLDKALLKGATLTSANLTRASLRGAWLIAPIGPAGGTRPAGAKADGAILVNACLDGAQCDGVDFARAVFATDPLVSMTRASADDAYLTRTAFNVAFVIGVSFRNTQLAGVNFSNAYLVASTFPSAKLTPTSETDPAPAVLSRADIRGTQFADVTDGGRTNPADMDGADLKGCVLSTSSGVFEQEVKGYGDQMLQLKAPFGVTVLGTTTENTTCPNGQPGRCTEG
jgi:uncharacterized protein YjbI with pentapeptide repeats